MHKNTPLSIYLLTPVMLMLCSCGTNSDNNIFKITANNDFEDITVISNGTNNPITIPVISNDSVVQLVDISFDNIGQSGHAFNYDNSITPYDSESQMSFHMNGGNPNIPGFPDAADMAGSISLDPTSNFTLPETVQLIYTPSRDNHGVDWFSYTPLGINGFQDTAYAFVRYVRIAQDQYEPDDFIQFARDITQYVFPVGTHHRETHSSDYANPSARVCSSYRALGGMTIRGDRDWFLIRLPSGANDLNLTVKAATPHEQSYSDRSEFYDLENELCISLIEEQTGVPPARVLGNGSVAQRFIQNPELPFPRPYWYGSRPSGAETPLVQLNRNSKNPSPDALWFKWPLDDASGFPTTVGTGKVFIRINPRPSIYSPSCSSNPAYEPHGEYRIEFLIN